MKLRTVIGIGITLIPVVFAIYSSFTSSNGFLSLKLNEQGDFLAGYIAPLALVWLVIGYLQQGEELEKNTEALQDQKEEFQEQNKSIKKQLFENTFFNLLNLHSEITESVKFETRQGLLEGRNALVQILLIFLLNLQRFTGPYNMSDEMFSDERGHRKIDDPQNYYGVKNESNKETVNEEYSRFYDCHQNHIGHYFRNLYLILKFIDESTLNSEREKKFYSNFLRAQLSSDELLLLFFNCSSDLGKEQFKSLLERYEFFEYLPKYQCLNGLETNFSSKAFGRNSEWKLKGKKKKRSCLLIMRELFPQKIK